MTRDKHPYAEPVFAFGEFRLCRERKELYLDGARVRVGGRALDLLIALLERAGEVVTKAELTAIAWPMTFVEESNLRVHVAALRKLLGDKTAGGRLIVNVPGRGYTFTGAVRRCSAEEVSGPDKPYGQTCLPGECARMIGRDDDLALLLTQIRRRRLVCVVGPAGVGKSMLAQAAAKRLSTIDGMEVRFVAVDPIEDGAMLPTAVAATLGLSSPPAASTRSLLAHLANKELLLVLDNVEHVVDAIAQLIGKVTVAAPGVRFLVTSREPLRLPGESLRRLAPLAGVTALGRSGCLYIDPSRRGLVAW